MSFLFFQSGCSLFGLRTAETPRFKLLAVDGKVEICAYEPHVVATTEVEAGDKDPQRTAFLRLADYIFAGNEKRQKIAATLNSSQLSAPSASPAA